MTRIEPHLLWIGHAGECRNFRQLFDEGIRALVDLAMEEPPSQPPRELIYCRFPLIEGPPVIPANFPEVASSSNYWKTVQDF